MNPTLRGDHVGAWIRRSLLTLALGSGVEPVDAATQYDITVNIPQCAIPSADLVFGFVSGGTSSNTARVFAFSTDGQRGAGRWRGGPVVGSLVGGGGPPYEATIQALGFENQVIVPMTSPGTIVTFSIELTEAAPTNGGMPDQFAFYVLNSDGSAVMPTSDPTGASAVFAVGVTGAAGGALEVFAPASLTSGNHISLKLCLHGGGGCPFVDTRTPGGWQVENSVLGRSATAALAQDAYHLKSIPQIQDRRLQVRIRENEQEYTTLDEVRMMAVDHTPDVRAYAVGGRMCLGTRVPAYRVTTSDGHDITSSVNGTGGYHWGSPGDTLLVQMTTPRPGGTFGATGTEDGAGGEGVLEGLPKETEVVYTEFRSRPAQPMNANAVDATVLASSGILVEVPDGSGGWRALTHYYPRQYADETVVDSLGLGPCRLIFVGRHRLDFVGRYLHSATPPAPQTLDLLIALHSQFGDAKAAVTRSGGTFTTLVPGDTLTLEFAATAVPPEQVRDYFLLSTGFYSATAPLAQEQQDRSEASRRPTRFALAQNQPNPFDRTTSIRFELPVESRVRLEIFDAQGRRVRTLANSGYPAGFHALEWDHRSNSGKAMGAGVYLYRIQAGSFRDQKSMVLLAR